MDSLLNFPIMRRFLIIIILGLLWSGSVFAEIITLHKCRDEGEKQMHPLDERKYYTIDLKNKKVTKVVTYSDEYHKAQLKYNKENPDKAIPISKTLIIERDIFYADENIIKANRETDINKNWLQISNVEIDLKKYKAYSSLGYTPKKGQNIPDLLKPSYQVEDCLLKK